LRDLAPPMTAIPRDDGDVGDPQHPIIRKIDPYYKDHFCNSRENGFQVRLGP
jgi:hypothetical protein